MIQDYTQINCFKMVPMAGLEPARDKIPTDFKSVASTYSATSAQRKMGFMPIRLGQFYNKSESLLVVNN